MTTNHLTADQLATSAPGRRRRPERLGLRRVACSCAVPTPRRWAPTAGTVATASSWANDPVEDVVGVLLTNQQWASPRPPPVATDFWTAAYAAIGA